MAGTTNQNQKGGRFYAAPSATCSASWSVYDRSLPSGRNVEVPHVTRDEAMRCAESLNAGRDAYAWLDGGVAMPEQIAA